jgi:small subunit ribosomal protein S6e
LQRARQQRLTSIEKQRLGTEPGPRKPLYTAPFSFQSFSIAEAPIKASPKGDLASGGTKMAEFKLVISDPKTGRSVQRDVKEDSAKPLIGLKLGDTFKGESIDLPGYEFKVTGGSDYAGFPMRADVQGQARKSITAVKGVGVKNKLRRPNPKKKGWRTMEGMRQKKTVAGNTIHAKTAQVNVKITKMGRDSIFPEKPAEGKKEAAPEKK